MVYFILFYFLLLFFLHWVMSLTNYENGVAMVKRLRTTELKGVFDQFPEVPRENSVRKF
jgi:mannose/fructose/N-acetylgalactosamine-specific phosphotransferase system component IID